MTYRVLVEMFIGTEDTEERSRKLSTVSTVATAREIKVLLNGIFLSGR